MNPISAGKPHSNAPPGESPVKPSPQSVMVGLRDLCLSYDGRRALQDISFEVWSGERFALLGPNGSGKSTLLRILSTLLRPSSGTAEVDGLDTTAHPGAVRNRLGVVFQTPGLDGKLSVAENLRFQGYLFGLSGRKLAARVDEVLERFGLESRRRDMVETLSGGLKRRAELAKALLHRPALLLLDEPSTGLDPAARRNFWDTLDQLHDEGGLTIVLTTHLMEEAERCGRVALLDQGRTVAVDTPGALKKDLGETVVVIETPRPAALEPRLTSLLGLEVILRDGKLHLSQTHGVHQGEKDFDASVIQRLLNEFGDEITAVRLGRPTLDDVFLARTGRTITGGEGGGDIREEGGDVPPGESGEVPPEDSP
ncbi:MAG: ABC transporter ATP-binding protein [bacterium]